MSAVETSFYVTGGTLRHDAPSYVERQADRDVSEGLLAGEFCYVLTPRQLGKSSLMVRTANKLREQGVNVIALDLTAIGQNLTAEQWYDGLIARMGRQLRLDEELDQFWRAQERLGPCQRLFAAIRDVVLRNRAGSLAIFVDEIDAVRSLPFSTDEFFAAIRECYNRRAEDPELNRVTFCLLGVATPSDLIRDTRTTPFNIGRRIELHDFTEAEAAPLAKGLTRWRNGTDSNQTPRTVAETEAAARNAERLLKRILFWTGGHPYLTQRFCHAVAGNARTANAAEVDQLCDELFLSFRARERDDNLLFVRERLLRSEADRQGLLELYGNVRRGRRVADDDTSLLVSVLRLSGIVKAEGGCLRNRNRIYAAVFDEKWIQAHIPGAELRRQQAAFYRGVMRTTAIAAVVVTALAMAVIIAINQAAKARKALAQSHLSQAQAHLSQAQAARKSGISGQRYESLQALRAARPYHTNEAILRDEVVACLALVDLKERRQNYSVSPADVYELSADSGVAAAGDAEGTITLRSLQHGEVLKTLLASGLRIVRLRFGPSEPVLVAEYRNGSEAQVIVWNWQTGQKLFSLPHDIHGEAIDFSADGRKLAIGQAGGRVSVYSLPQGRTLNDDLDLRWKSGHARKPQALRFSPSGECLAESSLDDPYVQVWALESTQQGQGPLMRLYHPGGVYDLAWHPQGELLATACTDSCVYLWNTNRTDYSKKLSGHEGRVSAVAFNHRGTLIASLGLDETVRLWIPATDRQMAGRWDGESLERLQFSTNDHFLVASGQHPANPRVWEVLGGEYVALDVRGGPADVLRTIDFSPDSRAFAAVNGQRAMLWEADSGREWGVLNFTNAHAAWFSADNRHLFASTDDGLFRGVLAHEGDRTSPRSESAVIHRLTQPTNELGAMAVTLDRSMAAIVHLDEVLLVPLETGRKSVRTIAVGIHYHRLAMHPTGQWMAAMIANSNSVHLWNLSEGAESRSPSALPSSEYFTFSPDGKWLVTCRPGRFDFYLVGAWQEPAFQIPRQSASDQHAPVAFTQDGSVVALAASRYTIQLRRLGGHERSGPTVIANFEAPDRRPLEMLAFSPDGRRLAATTKDQTIQLWNLALLRDGLAELNLHHDWPENP